MNQEGAGSPGKEGEKDKHMEGPLIERRRIEDGAYASVSEGLLSGTAWQLIKTGCHFQVVSWSQLNLQ